jgi:tetratricopeptide (TPR) repeat protein
MWRGRINATLDPEGKLELAKPFYEKCAELASTDATKNKKDLIEAYQYLGWLALQKDKNAEAKQYYQKVLELDPANEEAKKVVSTINKL